MESLSESGSIIVEDISNPDKNFETFDSLFEQLNDSDTPCDRNTLAQVLDELICTGFLEDKFHEDNTYYTGKHGLCFENFCNISDPIKQNILSIFAPYAKGFFIQLNTQKGKTVHSIKEIRRWIEMSGKKNIGFLVCDNDQTLTDQFIDSIKLQLGCLVQIFVLSAKFKTTYDEIKHYIDAFMSDSDNEYKMPLIILLANNIQCEKMVKLLHHINRKFHNGKTQICYSIIFDEADKTYPPLRDLNVTVADGSNVSLKTYLIDQSEALNRVGWVSATEGELLEEKYNEVANAHSHKVVIDENESVNYRAMHHPDAQIHLERHNRSHSNNKYAENILLAHFDDHFKIPIVLPSGEIYYKKIIINSSSKQAEMEKAAKMYNKMGMYAIVFNGFRGCSIKIYKDGSLFKLYKTTGKKFNEVLMFAYKFHGLSDKPLIIIGRRKVDRGLGFHYAPRDKKTIVISSPEVGSTDTVTLKDGEGLIWTDMILGSISNKNVAVQKAGRLAGIIAQCPQYCGSLHYWTDEATAILVKNHNKTVDEIQKLPGKPTVLQAMTRAKENIGKDLETTKPKEEKVIDHDLYRLYKNVQDFKNVLKALGYRSDIDKRLPGKDGFIKTTFNASPDIFEVDFIVRHAHTAKNQGGGGGAARTAFPCYNDKTNNKSLYYAVIIRDPEHLKKIPDHIKDTKVSLVEGKYRVIEGSSAAANTIIRDL